MNGFVVKGHFSTFASVFQRTSAVPDRLYCSLSVWRAHILIWFWTRKFFLPLRWYHRAQSRDNDDIYFGDKTNEEKVKKNTIYMLKSSILDLLRQFGLARVREVLGFRAINDLESGSFSSLKINWWNWNKVKFQVSFRRRIILGFRTLHEHTYISVVFILDPILFRNDSKPVW